MKTFLDYLNEDVVPAALVTNGTISLDNEETRASVNMALAKVTADSSITPYIALNRIAKALSYFSIILPKRVYLEGSKGVEVHEIRQFGEKMGMNDQGEFIREVPGKFYLFVQYGMNTPMNHGSQLAYPTMGGTFRVTAKVVDKVELDKLISMAELALAEECDAEMQQRKSKMLAPHDEMHDVTSDEKKKGNKQAVADSQKGIKEGILDTVRSMNPFNQLANKLSVPGASAAPKQDMRIMGNPDTAKKPAPTTPVKEEQIDELHGKGQLEKIRSGRYKKLLATRDEVPTHKNPHGTAIRRADNLRNMRDSQKVTRELGHKKDINYPSYRDIAKVDRASQKRKEKESGIKEETLDEISQRLVGRYRSLAGIDLTNRTNKALRDDQANRPVDKENRKKRMNRVAGIKRADAHFKEETLSELYGKGRLKDIMDKRNKDEYKAEKAAEKEHSSRKETDHRTGPSREDNALAKAKYERERANMTAHKLKKHRAKTGFKEETQLDELSRGIVARYKKAAESDKKSAESSAETSHAHRKNRALPLAKRNAFHDEEKWLKGIAKKREKGIAMADKRLEEGRVLRDLSQKDDHKPTASHAKKIEQEKHDKERKKTNRANSVHAKMYMKTGNKKWLDGMKEETLDEKLTKGMSAGDVISDFVHSDDPKFKGKSKKERQRMALGAYYGMHPEKSSKE